MMKKSTVLTLLLALPTLGFAAEYQELDALRQQVSSYTLQAAQAVSPAETLIELNVGKLSPLLNLPKCGERPELFVHNGKLSQRNVTIGVRCASDSPWTVYLPVSIQRYAAVYVANRAISRGQIIGAEDLRQEKQDLARLYRGYITDAAAILGKAATHNISAGKTIRPDAIDQASTIAKGETVTIAAQLQGIYIKMQGQALQGGQAGELIRVKNLSSNKIVEAEIVRPGVVQIRM